MTFSHVHIEANESDEPYAVHVRRWFLSALPGAQGQKSDDLEVVFEAFMASSKIRLGPRPSPESQVVMRLAITNAMKNGLPIPVLVPWGSEKPDEGPLDIAEIAGLRTLYDLNDRVRAVYSPGIQIRMRIEDASAPHLFYTRAEASWAASQKYTEQLVKLINILNQTDGQPILPFPESTRVTPAQFAKYANRLVPLFEAYIRETDLYGMDNYENRPSYKDLVTEGWVGSIQPLQRDYYRNTYAKLYGIDPKGERATHTLARYMSESLTRIHMGITGIDPHWAKDGYIQVSLVAPVPGAPIQRTGRTVYYRTLPENISSTHIPPWRAKGYLEAREDGSFRPHLTTPRLAAEAGISFHESCVTICRQDYAGREIDRVSIRTDYTI